MRPIVTLMLVAVVVLIGLAGLRTQRALATPEVGILRLNQQGDSIVEATHAQASTANSTPRSLVIVTSLTVFVLAVFVGFEVIAKVPPTLHTPLMSGSNAISGITVVGAIVIAGFKETGLGCFLGMIAVALAMINVVGGFAVTHRMLLMFKKR